jgi:hypothetical protein
MSTVPPGGTPNRPPRRNHCLVHDEGLPLQTCTCGAASRSEQSAATCEWQHGCDGVAIASVRAAGMDYRLCAAHLNELRNGGWADRVTLFAAEAAQSPQVGAATIDVCSCGDCDGTPHPGSEGHLYSRPWPPVASADPELAALREALQRLLDRHKDWLLDGAHGVLGEARRLAAGIDSALSRLAGQSATANASGGAARGSPEEER